MQELAAAFEALYSGLHRAHGAYTVTHADKAKAGKMAGKAVTVFETPTVDKWQSHLAGKQGLGIIPINEQNQCRWGAIDIDEYREGLMEEVEAETRRLALPVICIRTKSGGIHVTCFLKEFMDARIVRGKMMEIASALGFAGVEIYPKQVSLASEKDCGNWLNMPYFDADKTTRYAVYKNEPLTAEQFIQMAQALSCTPEQFIGIHIAASSSFDDGPPCIQTLAAQRVAVGGRNDAMFAMGVYARMKFGDDWEVKLDEYNLEFFTPPLPSREIQQLTKSLHRKNYFYPCSKPPLTGYCNKELCSRREFGINQGGTEPSVAVGKLVKLCTDPPTWIIDVEGARFELDTEQLMSQAKFAKACMEKINQWPPAIKPAAWQKLIQARLNDVEVIEAPKEASLDGRILWHLEQWCATTAPARARDEITLGKPWAEGGKHYFRSEDFARYLNQHGVRDFTPRKLWSLLRHEVKAEHAQFQIKGRCVQVWKVNEYQRQTEAFDVATPKEEF